MPISDVADPGPATPPSADQVAAAVAGVPTISEACRALRAAGWRSDIAGNRISVDGRVFARYVAQGDGQSGSPDARWVVYGTGERPVVRIVVARDPLAGASG